MNEKIQTSIEGCYIINIKSSDDIRGSFTKFFDESQIKNFLGGTALKEIYYTTSNKNVIRGLHFQSPPKDHEKLVHCAKGEVLDVIVDIRKKSSTYGKVLTFHLTENSKQTLCLPKGVAHGFLSLKTNSTLIYAVTSGHDQSHDTGILWSSIDFEWPISNPIVSLRDQKFTSFLEFDSPF